MLDPDAHLLQFGPTSILPSGLLSLGRLGSLVIPGKTFLKQAYCPYFSSRLLVHFVLKGREAEGRFGVTNSIGSLSS